jgi:hypothetical protein
LTHSDDLVFTKARLGERPPFTVGDDAARVGVGVAEVDDGGVVAGNLMIGGVLGLVEAAPFASWILEELVAFTFFGLRHPTGICSLACPSFSVPRRNRTILVAVGADVRPTWLEQQMRTR